MRSLVADSTRNPSQRPSFMEKGAEVSAIGPVRTAEVQHLQELAYRSPSPGEAGRPHLPAGSPTIFDSSGLTGGEGWFGGERNRRFVRVRRYLFFSTAMVIALACTAKLQAQFPFEPAGAERSAEDLVSVRAVSSIDVVHPGESFLVAVDFTIEPGWHIYWINPGSSGMPTRVSMKGPPGFGVQPLRFTRPTMIQEPEGLTFGYEKRAVLFVPVTAPDQLPGGEAAFELSIGFLVCKEVCLMGSQTLALVIPTSTAAPDSVEPRSLAGARPGTPERSPGSAPPAPHRAGRRAVEFRRCDADDERRGRWARGRAAVPDRRAGGHLWGRSLAGQGRSIHASRGGGRSTGQCAGAPNPAAGAHRSRPRARRAVLRVRPAAFGAVVV